MADKSNRIYIYEGEGSPPVKGEPRITPQMADQYTFLLEKGLHDRVKVLLISHLAGSGPDFSKAVKELASIDELNVSVELEHKDIEKLYTALGEYLGKTAQVKKKSIWTKLKELFHD